MKKALLSVIAAGMLFLLIGITPTEARAENTNLLSFLSDLASFQDPMKFGFGRTGDGREFFWVVGKSRFYPNEKIFTADLLTARGIEDTFFLSKYFLNSDRPISAASFGNMSSEEIADFLEEKLDWKMWH